MLLILRFNKAKLVRGSRPYEDVYLFNLAYLSSSYAKGSSVYIILGKTDEDQMHALVIPHNREAPELKTIPLTWAEAQAILQRKWEDRYGSFDPVPDSNTGSDMGSGERSDENLPEASDEDS